jgi:pyruvate formate-lyase/glycerol dehydratase family glycyl radical enzyme
MNSLDKSRISIVRNNLLNITPSICSERALLVTESYKETEGEPVIIRRAKALDKILTEMSIYIENDQLIVGNQASAGKAAPIFPKYSYEWVIEELDQFDKRVGDVFTITEETKDKLRNIGGYWKHKTHQDEVKRNLTEANKLAEKQNIIHRGGISMSGDGHIIPNHDKILEFGYIGFIKRAEEKLQSKDLTKEKTDFYRAVIIALNAAAKFSLRFSILAKQLSIIEKSNFRKNELLRISEICKNIGTGKPKSFHEAVQIVYFTHLIMMIESNGHSFSFGRFDQYIYPFYQKDILDKKISKDDALEITSLFFVKLNSLNKVRPWGHTEFGVGYPLYSNLMIGGMKKDQTDGTNEMSYICLDAMSNCRLPEPNLSARYWEKTPKAFLKRSAELIKDGYGMPSLFADETVIKSFSSIGIDEETARDYASMGCVEVAIPGRWGHRATGMTYINFAKIFELLLNNGVDPVSKIQIVSVNGKKDSKVSFNSYKELFDSWKKLLKFYTDLAVESDYICDRSLKFHDADPFASSLIDCCLDRGKTLKEGGAEYDFVSQTTIGTTTVGDSLAAIKKLVFDDKSITYEDLMEAMELNWQGEKAKEIQRTVFKAPKFGNDIDYVDNITSDVYDSYISLLPDYKNERNGNGPKGCGYTMSTSNISSNVPGGMDVGATPDGRYAGEPLNEGASPCRGADMLGPTAVIKSVSKLPNSRMAGGQLLNMKFTSELLSGEGNMDKFVSFIEANRLLGNFHSQFNIVDRKTLIDAKENPEEYPNLMVRVAGYCALFTSLMPSVQDDIIKRTQHSEI